MQNIDYIIVGGGIAGVTLAHHLEKQGFTFHLYNLTGFSSSRIAAGLFNPVTGRKMVKTWKADILFPYLKDFYQRAEQKINGNFYHDRSIYRPFISIEEQNDWVGKSSDPGFTNFIKEVHKKSCFEGKYNDPFGGLELNYSGWIDTVDYLDSSLTFFKSKSRGCQLHNEDFDASRIQHQEDGVVYKNVKARNLIFCDGNELKNNPYFSWLPLQPLKGEIIEVKLPFRINIIFNRGVFILPVRGNIYRVGSTYDHSDISWNKTERGKQQLISKLRALLSSEYKITGHTAGVRPSTKDRRPFLGSHPEYKNIYIFNGLGTKGVSLAPFFAGHLIDHIEGGSMLNDEVNIQRFFSLYCT